MPNGYEIMNSLRSLFVLLNQNEAILGRTESQIVLSRQLIPSILMDDSIFSDYRFELETEELELFCDVFTPITMTERFVLLGVSHIEWDEDWQFAEILEFRSVLAAIPEVDHAVSVEVEQACQKIMEFLAINAQDISGYLFSATEEGGLVEKAEEKEKKKKKH